MSEKQISVAAGDIRHLIELARSLRRSAKARRAQKRAPATARKAPLRQHPVNPNAGSYEDNLIQINFFSASLAMRLHRREWRFQRQSVSYIALPRHAFLRDAAH